MEVNKGFEEARTDQKFFNLGENNNWKNFLPLSIKERIEKNFYHEMKELKYLD